MVIGRLRSDVVSDMAPLACYQGDTLLLAPGPTQAKVLFEQLIPSKSSFLRKWPNSENESRSLQMVDSSSHQVNSDIWSGFQ